MVKMKKCVLITMYMKLKEKFSEDRHRRRHAAMDVHGRKS